MFPSISHLLSHFIIMKCWILLDAIGKIDFSLIYEYGKSFDRLSDIENLTFLWVLLFTLWQIQFAGSALFNIFTVYLVFIYNFFSCSLVVWFCYQIILIHQISHMIIPHNLPWKNLRKIGIVLLVTEMTVYTQIRLCPFSRSH